jgi:putative nucleotidyltransferase with HDIG domain
MLAPTTAIAGVRNSLHSAAPHESAPNLPYRACRTGEASTPSSSVEEYPDVPRTGDSVSEVLQARPQSADVVASAVSAISRWCGPETASDPHAAAVAGMAVEIAQELGVDGGRRFAVAAGALLHDVGKTLLDQHILQKPGPLDEAEREHVQTHAAAGAAALPPDVPDEVRSIVRFHHERWDGRGYPHGIGYAAIPLEARIVAVADAFQAMVEDRPYRPRRSLPDAIEEVVRSAGSQFDPACVQAFARLAGARRASLRILQLAPQPRNRLARLVRSLGVARRRPAVD